MSTTFENNNPYAVPVGLHHVSEQRLSHGPRASARKLRAVNRLVIVADLAYVAVFGSFILGLYFGRGEAAMIATVGFWVTLFLFWYTVVAGLFRAKGISFASMMTPFILPWPLFGTVAFLFAKEDIRKFMIVNGYRPRLLGFSVDADERKKMEQDPTYEPSQSTHHDGTKRKYVFSLAECWLALCFTGFLIAVANMYFNLVL